MLFVSWVGCLTGAKEKVFHGEGVRFVRMASGVFLFVCVRAMGNQSGNKTGGIRGALLMAFFKDWPLYSVAARSPCKGDRKSVV